MAEKKTRGRQKMEMKLIEVEKNRLVTFSKHRSGIYKKVGELSILCGAEIAMLGITASGKPYSFCTPSEKAVLDKYLDRAFGQSDPTLNLLGTAQSPRMRELIEQHNALLVQSEEQTRQIEALKRTEGAHKSRSWWEADMEKLCLQEIQVMDSLLEDLLNQTNHCIDKLTGGPASLLFTSLKSSASDRSFGHRSTKLM